MLEHMYRRGICNMQGLKALTKQVQIPDARLGIGVAEHHAAMGVKITYQNHVPKLVTPSLETVPYEKARAYKLEADMFETDNFHVPRPIMGV